MKCFIRHGEDKIRRESDTLLVIGDGRSMIEDVPEFYATHVYFDVCALGRGIKDYPGKVLHWFNSDGETAIHWAKNLPNGIGTIKHTFGEVEGFDVDWEIEQPDYHYEEITGEKGRNHGTSALFATLAGLYMGYQEIVLAGCPMDTEGHYYFDETYRGPLWFGLDFMAWLDFAETPEAKKVKSLSGYTQKILGR